MNLDLRPNTMGERARQIAVRVLLCLVIGLQLGSASACQPDSAPRVASQNAPPELAALASALGHPVALCHDASSDKSQKPGPASHHGCCDCGMCGATAFLLPSASGGARLRGAMAADVQRRDGSFVLSYAPRTAATSPRGPPLDV